MRATDCIVRCSGGGRDNHAESAAHYYALSERSTQSSHLKKETKLSVQMILMLALHQGGQWPRPM